MVYLTMTPAMVAALETICRHQLKLVNNEDDWECPLNNPIVGNPVCHSQVIAISRLLGSHEHLLLEETLSYHLDDLLRGSRIFRKPSKPKQEPTSSYKALMERLRREEEARAYERMINPPMLVESHAHYASQAAKLFPTSTQTGADDDDEITYADVNRQMALIINILVSIVACSVAIWIASSHWSTPKRLGLSMGGSGLIGVGEVVVYAGYLRRLKEAREKGKKHLEVKEIIKTWVIGGNSPAEGEHILDETRAKTSKNETLRKRRVD